MVFNFGKCHTLGVNVVNREETLDASATCHAGNETGHPVVAMNQVGPRAGYDVVDHFALENQGDVHGFRAVVAVHLFAVIKNPVLGEMDVRVGQHFVILP